MVTATPPCQLSGSQPSGVSSRFEMTGSPMAPSARLESVTPSWMAEMKRAGFCCRSATRRAPRLP